jgi:hypothetical protein
LPSSFCKLFIISLCLIELTPASPHITSSILGVFSSGHLDSLCPTGLRKLRWIMKEAEAIDRVRQVLRRQHKALAPEEAYVLWLRRYIKAPRQMPPELSSEKKLEKFLTDLAREHDVSHRI